MVRNEEEEAMYGYIVGAVFLLGICFIFVIFCCCRGQKDQTTENLAQQVDAMQPGETPPPWPVVARCTDRGDAYRPATYKYIQTHPQRAYLPERTLPQTPAPDPAMV